MADFDPAQELDLEADASPQDRRAAYRRRLAETDPDRVRGMDPRVVEAAREARARVEYAWALLEDPKNPPPAPASLGRGPEATGAAAAEPAKSYLRALWMTVALPGTGSWYGGGRSRGLVALGVFALGVAWIVHGASGALRAVPEGGGVARILAQLAVLKQSGADFGVLVLLLAADAALAVWAHNDRVAAAARRLPGAGPSAGRSG